MKKTIIVLMTDTGRVSFRAELFGHLSRKEIRKECKKWCVDYSKAIVYFK